jgi:hypothetical protein
MLLQTCKRRNPSSNPVDYYVIRSPSQREPSIRRLWPSCRIRIQKKSKAVPRAPKSGHNKSNYIKRGLTGSKKNIESCEILKIEDDIGKSAILRYPCGEIRTQQQRWRAFDSAFQKGHWGVTVYSRQTPTSPWPAKLCIFRATDDWSFDDRALIHLLSFILGCPTTVHMEK